MQKWMQCTSTCVHKLTISLHRTICTFVINCQLKYRSMGPSLVSTWQSPVCGWFRPGWPHRGTPVPPEYPLRPAHPAPLTRPSWPWWLGPPSWPSSWRWCRCRRPFSRRALLWPGFDLRRLAFQTRDTAWYWLRTETLWGGWVSFCRSAAFSGVYYRSPVHRNSRAKNRSNCQ